MGFGETVVAIVLITAVAGVLRTLFGGGRSRREDRMMRHMGVMHVPQPDPEANRLREEVRGLKERVAVLERVITDQSSASALDREFEKLKSMD
ncbi:MAG: hypothetical protein J7494_01005 [Sphingobium sp.]|nr:hypothetical protein [Sphingobium sp.]